MLTVDRQIANSDDPALAAVPGDRITELPITRGFGGASDGHQQGQVRRQRYRTLLAQIGSSMNYPYATRDCGRVVYLPTISYRAVNPPLSL